MPLFKGRFYLSFLFYLTMVICNSNDLIAQEGAKKSLTISDYGKWESLGFDRSFSDNGEWFFYGIRRNNDKNELRLHNVPNGTVKVLPEGARARFSGNSQWLGYFINPSAAERKKSKTPLRSDFRLLSLIGQDSLTVKNVSSFVFSDDSRFLAMKHFPAKGKKSKGGDLVLRNLESGTQINFGNVSEFAWQEDGSLLAMVIDADGRTGNGVQLYDSNTGTLRVLNNHEASFTGLKWSEKSTDLAVFRSFKDKTLEDSTQHILAWKGLGTRKESSHLFDQATIANFPENNRIVNNRSLTWADNGNAIFFNITHWQPVPETDTTKTDKNKPQDLRDEAPDLQIWHSKDVQVIPEQEQLAQRKREDQFTAVWHLDDNSFVQLGDDLTEIIVMQTDAYTLLGLDQTPYELEGMFGRGGMDVYSVDIKTGAKNKAIENLSYINSLYRIDKTGRYIPNLKGNDVYLKDLQTGINQNLTATIDADFSNQDDDHPMHAKFPYGFIAWEKNGKSFFAHSKYDVWQFWVDGKSRKLTDGSKDEIRHRFSRIEFEDYIDEKEPMYLSLFGLLSKKSGYASVVPGKAVKTLTWQDARLSRLTKSEDVDRFAFSAETFDDSPDYFVASDNFANINQLSETNPFQKDYHWGRAELIDYTNHHGKKLQGVLYYPANYEAGKKYPMITYIYEKLSDGMHSYGQPSQRNYYSHGVFTQEGYFVLRPDIEFDARDPGISSTKTLEAAVKKVVDMGLIDEKRVGLVGHSWGGYQAGFVVTQTDIFAASVAGAGLTDFPSMYAMIAWAFGGAPESAHFEVSQERMEVPPYEDIEAYIRNSSVFNVNQLNTPLLFEVGDADKNVDWKQGIEYYNVARRARKQFVLLVYAKEGHGLRQDKNRADYQMRILKWFGHYLKGEEAPAWITDGVPYEKQMRDLKNWKN